MFQVDWQTAAINELARIWMAASSPTRALVTATVHQFDLRLTEAAETEGESRAGIERITFEGPLGIKFHVKGKTAIVHHVWYCGPRK